MDSPRSAKRRKLSTSNADSTAVPTPTRASARKAQTPTTGPNSKRGTTVAKSSSTPTSRGLATKAAPNSAPKPKAAPAPAPSRSSLRKSLPATSNKPKIDVYDDIEGAHDPSAADASALPHSSAAVVTSTATTAAAPTPGSQKPNTLARSASTRAEKKESEKSVISTAAGHKGLNSLRARLEAKLAAAAAAKNPEAQAGPGVNISEAAAEQNDTGSDAGQGATLAEEEKEVRVESGREVIEIDAYEKEQIAKAIRRMNAKEANRKIQEEKMRRLAAGETASLRARAGTPKTNGQTNGATREKRVYTKKIEKAAVTDDTSCKICGKLNSPKHNMIVMCDGCDNAYHQKCHEPNITAKMLKEENSDWFCAECMFKMKVNATSVVKRVSAPSVVKKDKPIVRQVERGVDNEPANAESPTARPLSPAKSAQKSPTLRQARELSPMVLDLPDERQVLRTPSEGPTPVKPLTKPRSQPQPSLKTRPEASLDLSISSEDLEVLQHTVLQQLTGRRPNLLIGLDNENAQIATLVDQTISSGESNSLLIIGARGSGKSAVVDSILASQMQTQPDAFHVVRLNGFIHTDDKVALREIWRQLGKEMQTEEIESAGSKNYADALTTLLALLSHHSEIGQHGNDEDGVVKSKSVVFVLDEFDMFTTHPRQTLLYNLFDIAQSRKAPILVLGLTTRFDVAEQLEKRVKSRFSHRFVHLGLAKNLDVFTEMCLSCLTPSSSEEDVSNLPAVATTAWSAVLTDLLSTAEMQRHLRRIYYTTKSLPSFKSTLLIPLSTLPVHPPPGSQTEVVEDVDSTASIPAPDLLTHLTTSIAQNFASSSLFPPDSKLPLLHHLSTLQLSLLIAAARLTIIHDTETVSFALAYEEYKTLASRARIASSANASAGGGVVATGVGRVWGKDVARGAWEGLVGLELIMEEGGRGGKGVGGDGFAGRVDVLLEEIRESGVEMGLVMSRWCREI